MSPVSTKLRALKSAALKWATAKAALESYVNGIPPAKRIDQAKFEALTLAYLTAERELEALACTESKQPIGWGA